ncbi:uncharacterized protein LOC130670701 [Microplitis mediator]|uniref:uncharacterized protein LOC130670701 n=1 Tax=Microplitis mediator TaxID=375433 RepID=UPI002554F020|nr:uncharacterized protein LOC130670701 [Microplitis mediator]
MDNDVDLHVVRTLSRVRKIIAEVIRSYQSSEAIDYRALHNAKRNLLRISSKISITTYNQLFEGIEALLLINNNEQQATSYVAPRINSEGKGRPRVQVSKSQLLLLYNEGFTAINMAKCLGCSMQTVYKKLYELNLPIRARYNQISDDELKAKINQIHQEHPNAGQTMMQAYLEARNINVQRNRVRQILNEVDPIGTASRWSQSIQRRTYKVATPNSLWHMDAHLKLSRWGFVIHGCIDGYSRLIIYLSCEMSIQAEPVVSLFASAAQRYGLPSRVRSDHGYENIFVAFLMNAIRGLERGSHITGKSVHNQRIERLWVDVYKEVCDSVYSELYSLEDENLLDKDNVTHRFCIQYVYKTVINERLSSFQSAWNMHNIRTENNRSPRQLWIEGILGNYNTQSTAVNDVLNNDSDIYTRLYESLQILGVDLTAPITHRDEINCPPSSFLAILETNQEQKILLENIISQDKTNKEKYILCVNVFTS